MTRVVQPRDFGGPDQLELVEVDTPEPGEGEVRVAVRAIGVNPVDWYHYDGVHTDDPEDLHTFGYEVAGVVEAIGPGVTGFAAGDEVVASDIPGNGYAEHVLVPASGLLPKPANITFEVAASVPVAAGTAYHALEKTHVGAGDVVLAHGAAGGVGTVLVQLARERGARVIATARPDKHDYLRSLGAEPVAYGEGPDGDLIDQGAGPGARRGRRRHRPGRHRRGPGDLDRAGPGPRPRAHHRRLRARPGAGHPPDRQRSRRRSWRRGAATGRAEALRLLRRAPSTSRSSAPTPSPRSPRLIARA